MKLDLRNVGLDVGGVPRGGQYEDPYDDQEKAGNREPQGGWTSHLAYLAHLVSGAWRSDEKSGRHQSWSGYEKAMVTSICIWRHQKAAGRTDPARTATHDSI